MKPVEAANKEVAKALLNDLEDIQWTAINETFFDLIELVKKKYLKNNLLDVNTVSALRDFFKYFKDISIWVHSSENKWYEGSALDLLKTVLGENSFDKQRHEIIKISDRGIVSKFHDVR